jgi:serine protease Do
MGRSTELKKGQWCITTGHPNGLVPGRTPVVRLGRILEANDDLVRTDCTLVGGDSGGPLFDMQGRVIGIHSRIGPFLTMNIHVPVDTYRDTWDLLTKGEVWSGPWLGFQADAESKICKIEKVEKNSPAEKGGLRPDDVITRFAGHEIRDFTTLRALLKGKKPGDKVAVEVLRGDETVSLELVVGGKK